MIDNILTRLEKVRPNGTDRWMACCPGHADTNPSLSIKYTGERVLLHCFAGCDTADVLDAVGLSWRDVMPPSDRQGREAYKRFKDTQRLQRALEHEELVLTITENSIEPLSDVDIERNRLAKQRIAKIKGVLNG